MTSHKYVRSAREEHIFRSNAFFRGDNSNDEHSPKNRLYSEKDAGIILKLLRERYEQVKPELHRRGVSDNNDASSPAIPVGLISLGDMTADKLDVFIQRTLADDEQRKADAKRLFDRKAQSSPNHSNHKRAVTEAFQAEIQALLQTVKLAQMKRKAEIEAAIEAEKLSAKKNAEIEAEKLARLVREEDLRVTDITKKNTHIHSFDGNGFILVIDPIYLDIIPNNEAVKIDSIWYNKNALRTWLMNNHNTDPITKFTINTSDINAINSDRSTFPMEITTKQGAAAAKQRQTQIRADIRAASRVAQLAANETNRLARSESSSSCGLLQFCRRVTRTRRNQVAVAPPPPASGGNRIKHDKHKYNGRMYKVRTGTRGGKYIVLHDENDKQKKMYLRP